MRCEIVVHFRSFVSVSSVFCQSLYWMHVLLHTLCIITSSLSRQSQFHVTLRDRFSDSEKLAFSETPALLQGTETAFEEGKPGGTDRQTVRQADKQTGRRSSGKVDGVRGISGANKISFFIWIYVKATRTFGEHQQRAKSLKNFRSVSEFRFSQKARAHAAK